MADLYTLDALEAVAKAAVDRHNERSSDFAKQHKLDIQEKDTVKGSCFVVVDCDGNRQGSRFRLPESKEDIWKDVLAMCEPKEHWKEGFVRDFGSPPG